MRYWDDLPFRDVEGCGEHFVGVLYLYEDVRICKSDKLSFSLKVDVVV